MDAAELNRHVEGAAAAHQRLLAALDPPEGRLLNDELVIRASRLPKWSVGHVLAHLEHNAWSLVRLFEGAEAGIVADQYPSVESRNSDIDRDSARSAGDHVDGLRRSIYALEAAWNAAREGWLGHGRNLFGELMPIAELPLRRWREVEVHSSDLGIIELSLDSHVQWSNEYVRHDLRALTMRYVSRSPMGLSTLPAEVMLRTPHERLAWLLGRLDIDRVGAAGVMS